MDEEQVPNQFIPGDAAVSSTDNLYRMARFYKFYTEQKEIVAQVLAKASDKVERCNKLRIPLL